MRPRRSKLLGAGAFGALLRAALGSAAEEHCDSIIQQTAAVGIMYLATMVGVAMQSIRGLMSLPAHVSCAWQQIGGEHDLGYS